MMMCLNNTGKLFSDCSLLYRKELPGRAYRKQSYSDEFYKLALSCQVVLEEHDGNVKTF